MSTNGKKGRVINLEATLQHFIETTEATFLRVEQQAERDREAWNQRAERDREAWEQHLAQYALEQKQEKKEWNKQRGELANSLGRVVEDIVAPNIPRIAEEQFGYRQPALDFSVRRKVYYEGRPDKQREFDTIAVYPDAVFLNETKETVRQNYVEDFVDFLESGEFYRYFPQYQGRKLVPIFSSLYLAEPIVNYLTKHNVYALAMGDETMTLLNFEQLQNSK